MPIVIVSPGLGTRKDMGLISYCERFRASGFAGLAIDYRKLFENVGMSSRRR